MVSRIIFYAIVLVICSVQSSAKQNDTVPNNVICLGPKKCIYKCCPHGQYVAKKKVCTPKNAPFENHAYNVYDDDLNLKNKSVLDTFTFIPGKFAKDKLFHADSGNLNSVGYRTYFMESGILIVEMPNAYYRYVKVNNESFCVDFRIDKKNNVMPVPKVWAVMTDEQNQPSDIYMTSATLVSCVFMLLVLVVYYLLPELQNLCGMILMAYVASLLMAFLLLSTIQMSVYTEETCLGLTFCIYYFFLASFCWMNIMSYDIWWTFRGYAKARPIHRRGERFKFMMYALYAWGLPLAMTIAFGILDTIDMKEYPWFVTPSLMKTGCFLEGGVKLLYLYMPMLIMIIFNWILFLMTAFNLWRLNRSTAVLDTAAAGTPAAHRSQRHRFLVYLKLSIVMGLNWVFEIVSFLYPGFKIWCISDVYNILIGLMIFLIFVCKKKIYRKLYKRYVLNTGRRFYPGSSKSYSSNSNSDSAETTTLQISPNPKGAIALSASANNL
ncbi:G-protein coupled receptor Mth2-like [Anticarsia gemmatalis]|uniref:G-protein coupled receptor Mth2-like n=1 Tax=Anticarsia gemmatalis TaxID=129554 RepID=UPI003F773781